jgi:glucosamine kinase
MDGAMKFVIGLDGGGSKTAAVLMCEDGDVLARGQGGPANRNFVPPEAVNQSVRQAISEAIAKLPADGQIIAVGGHIIAPTELFAVALHELTPGLPYHDFAEAEIAAVGIVGREQPGVVLIAGTGSQATAFGAQGQRKSVGGWGTPLGDEGGAGWIGWAALRAATRAYEGRATPTCLTEAIYAHFHIANLWELIAPLYRGDLPRHQIAALAPLVARCAAEGDVAARQIMQEGGAELALLAATAARHAGLSGSAFPVVTAGGVFRAGAVLITSLAARLAELEPGASFCPPRYPPEVGGALLTLKICRSDWQSDLLA